VTVSNRNNSSLVTFGKLFFHLVQYGRGSCLLIRDLFIFDRLLFLFKILVIISLLRLRSCIEQLPLRDTCSWEEDVEDGGLSIVVVVMYVLSPLLLFVGRPLLRGGCIVFLCLFLGVLPVFFSSFSMMRSSVTWWFTVAFVASTGSHCNSFTLLVTDIEASDTFVEWTKKSLPPCLPFTRWIMSSAFLCILT